MCINNVVSLRHYTSPQTSTHTHTNLSSQAKTLAKSNKQSDCECEEGENSILWSRIHLLPELNWNFIVQVTVNLKTLNPIPPPQKKTHTHTHKTKERKFVLSPAHLSLYGHPINAAIKDSPCDGQNHGTIKYQHNPSKGQGILWKPNI